MLMLMLVNQIIDFDVAVVAVNAAVVVAANGVAEEMRKVSLTQSESTFLPLKSR